MSLYEVPITKLSGIGEKRAALFRKLGISSVGDMITCYPRSYDNWSATTPISEVQPDTVCVVRGKVATPINNIRISFLHLYHV